MTRVEFDCGEEAFTVGKRSSIGKRCSSIGKRRGSIVGSGKGGRVVEGVASSVDISGVHLSGSLCPGCLCIVGGKEVCPRLNNLRGVNHWAGGNTHRGNRQVVSYDAESKIVGNVVDRVHPGLVNVGVGALDPAVDVASLLLGRIDVLVPVGNVACLVLGLELAAGDRADWSRLLRIGGQLGVLGIRGCILSINNWRAPTQSFLVSCHWTGGEGTRSEGCHRGAIGKPGIEAIGRRVICSN